MNSVPTPAAFDAAAAAAAVNAAAAVPDPGQGGVTDVIAAKLDQLVAAGVATVVNTGRLQRDLDDVIRGELVLNTQAA